MNNHYANLLRISSELASVDPLNGYKLEACISVATKTTTAFHRFAADPSIKNFRSQIKNLIDVMTEARDELENEGKLPDFKDLESAFKDINKLLKLSFHIASSNRVANLSKFVKSIKDKFLKDNDVDGFFDGADDVLKQLDEVKKNPDKELAQGIIAQLEAFIQQGNDLLKKAQEFEENEVNPQGKAVTIEGDEPVNPEGKEVSFDHEEPTQVKATPEREGYEFERIVQHYVDNLQNALKAQDHNAINKFLKELFAEVQANVEEDVAKIAARRAAQMRILPILVRFAHARPHLRPMFLPHIKVAMRVNPNQTSYRRIASKRIAKTYTDYLDDMVKDHKEEGAQHDLKAIQDKADLLDNMAEDDADSLASGSSDKFFDELTEFQSMIFKQFGEKPDIMHLWSIMGQ